MHLKSIFKQHKSVFLIAILIVIILAWTFIRSFSEDIDNSAWDGVVADSFTSGTGTLENPYVIANASQYAYFKSLLEGEDAALYATKNYSITSSFNYGEYDITINNEVPFSGSINGNFNLIYNAKLTNSFFALVSNATIKNINFDNISVTSSIDSGVIANEMEDTSIMAVSLNGTIAKSNTIEDKVIVAGIAYKDNSSTIKDVVINLTNENVDYIALVADITDTEFLNVIVGKDSTMVPDGIKADLSKVYELDFSSENISLDGKLINEINKNDYLITIKNNKLLFEKYNGSGEEPIDNQKGPSKAPSRSAAISVHASGIDTTNGNIYINDLTSDYNYYMGLNYTKISNTTGALPSGNNQNLYSNSNLATVYIRYSGADYNDSSVYGTVSVSETVSNYYYFKRYPVVSGYVTFDLIDNPWANRPGGRAFNGWVTDYTGAVVSLNIDTYVRSVKIPVSDVSTPISITFYTNWTIASIATSTSDISSTLKSAQMTEIPADMEDISEYYVAGHINYGYSYPSGTKYDMNGNRITRSSCNSYPGGCNFVVENGSDPYDSNADYYQVTPINNNTATLTQVFPTKTSPVSYYGATASAAGLFVRVTSGTENIYSSSGQKLTSCGSSCYKLLQFSDGVLDMNTTYYYLVTRDTNIFAPTGTSSINATNISTSVPLTITGINNGVDSSNNRLILLNNNWQISSDMRIEFIRFYVNSDTTDIDDFGSGYKIIGNFKNLKIGRGMKRYSNNGYNYLTATAFAGGYADYTSSLQKYTTIVESGFYQNGSAVGYTTAYTHYVNADVTLGSDYDRIAGNNNNLIIYYCYAGSWASNLYSTDSGSNSYEVPAIYSRIKSGTFGQNKIDYAAGVYVGGRSRGTHYALREVLVEGGYIYNLIGGPSSSTARASKNDIVINVKGGEIDLVFGGAGASNTVGNRILNITGGTINYSILGGSNANQYSSNTSDPDGKIDGDTLIYVGGNVTVGTKSDTLFTVPSGDVYGAGNGREGAYDVGAVNNSNVIIGPSATIKGDVYGGGNNGAVGGNTVGTVALNGEDAATPDDTVGVYEDGTIDNNIRFSGNNPDNYIQFNGENYRIIGLFNNVSTANGNKDLVRIIKPTYASNSVAWSDEYITSGNNRYYSNYYVRNNAGATKSNIYDYLNTTYYNSISSTYRNYIQSVNWGLGATEAAGHDTGDFYTIERGNTPGSDYSATSYNFNIGLFYPSDYGFAYDDSTCLGLLLTTYGSNNTCRNNNWMASIINSNSWTMTSSTYYDTNTSGYGNNRRTNYRYYGFYLNSSDNLARNRIYYNSYQAYAVFPSFYLKDDVMISSGDGSAESPYIIGSTGKKLTDLVYELMYPPAPPEPDEPEEPEIIEYEESDYQNRTHINIIGGTIEGSVYGAGNNNGAGNNTKGSNGRVALSKITIDMNGGSVGESIYGGANAYGPVYGDVFLNIENGTVGESVYGGGKGGYTSSSDKGTYIACNVNVNIGSENTTNLTISDSVYGGSAFGTVNGLTEDAETSSYATKVTVNNGVIVGSVFGGGEGDNSHTPKVYGPITVTINDGDITNVFGGNDQAGTYSSLDRIYLNGGTVDNVYGGGNKSSVNNTHVYLQGSTVTSLYGGSNTSGNVNDANVEIKSGTVQTVYGGNNEGGTCGVTHVKVEGTAQINGAVYGGGNQVNTTTTNVTLTSAGATIPNVYGGGNSASVGTSNVTKTGTTVTNLFGGSNSTGTVTTSNINHNGGTTTNIFGGNNAGGNTIASNITMHSGNVTTIYGGGNQANGDNSHVTVDGGTTTTIFGGGNRAGLDVSNVTVSAGVVNEIYGGSNNSGKVNTTNVTFGGATGTVSNIFGGGNNAEVGSTNVTINGGTTNNVYGGGNLAQATGNANVDVNGGTITTLYGGGNQGAVLGNANTFVTDANILGNAYASGNGSSAVVHGNATITIDGDTVVGTATSTAPDAGCVFGGGNRAATGIQAINNSTTTVNIVGGTIYGNVYGGAKFAVIYGNTVLNIGEVAYTSQTLQKDDIDIKGHIFGGGEANSSGSSDIYDWSFISVTRGVNMTIDADTYTNFNIAGSFYGGGNASTASGDSYLLIRNYGATGDPEDNVSIQRVTYVTIENSSILLRGARDRANDYEDEPFSISRVVSLKIKDNSEIYFMSRTNLLEEFISVDENDTKAQVTINTNNNTITSRNVDNRIYIYERKNVNIAHDQNSDDPGSVSGMTFLGLFNFDNNGHVNNGIYNANYAPGATLPATGLFAKGGTVIGRHETNHDITVDGFYTNNMNSSKKNEIGYVQPSPDDALYYMWHVGANAIEYNLNLVASKYSTMGAKELSFLEFSQPNTSFNILSFESINIAEGISLVDRSSIPRIAADPDDANNIFGLSLEASNNGWLTTGKTSFFTREPSISGVRYYEGENTTIAPSLLFYLYHSKNITEEKDLGTVSITIQAITKLNAISVEEDLLVVNVNMSTALFQTDDYEGAMTPGDKYELFMSTTTNITSKSKYSAYYSLFGSNKNLYRTGYHRVLTSTFVFPENTKITMLDFVNGVPQYYYHVITAADVAAAQADYQANNNEQCAYALSMFTLMGSINSSSNYNDALKNAIYYDGTDSNEEFIFIVDFADANITSDKLNQKLLIEIRDSNEEDIVSVLGVQHAQLTYNVYANKDSQIDINVDESDNPLYIGYNDIFDVLINYQSSTLSGAVITDTQYFDSKMGVQIYIKDKDNKVVSGTDLTGCYFLMDDTRYYPDISGYTHIKLADKVGNTRKWIIFNTENSSLGTGSYTFVFEAFASADGIYYSSGDADYENIPITVINSTYGLDPVINDESVIFSSTNNTKSLKFNIAYSSRLDNPNLRLAMYRRKYVNIYDTEYELVDFQDYSAFDLTTTNNLKEYLLLSEPAANNGFTYLLKNELITGTYRLSFRLYDDDTMIGEINRYIIIK